MRSCMVYKNAKVNYSIYGSGGKILMLLHGFLERSEMWSFLIDELKNEYKIITVDLLGHGESECLGYIHTMEEMAAVVHQILEKEDISKITAIGHSMGGYVALALAEKHPEIFEGLCLLNATSQSDSEERKKIRNRAIAMAKTNYKTLVSMSINNLFASETYQEFKEEIEACRQDALKTPVQGYIACTEGMKLRKNREEVLVSTNFKKLIITGKKDPVLHVSEIQEEAKRTNTPLVTVSNGHMSHIENREEIIKELKEFCAL
ncbi:alpha/beta hydrolase [uncultured Tenacibaculum sp.]|uniref:alpha/beta fold hydrolase n=1 Tax=uncultured Tenacibaculum sp. TaxID=174713 RepID=UPI00260255C7|nr:alpha/beta hydrolase [uncultured Tenacibaculum sp.]